MTQGHVYIATYDTTPDIVKIGMTLGCPHDRVSAWGKSTGSPGNVQMIWYAEVDDARAVESEIHASCGQYKIGGGGNEWFNSPDVCLKIAKEIADRHMTTCSNCEKIKSDSDYIASQNKLLESEIKEHEYANLRLRKQIHAMRDKILVLSNKISELESSKNLSDSDKSNKDNRPDKAPFFLRGGWQSYKGKPVI